MAPPPTRAEIEATFKRSAITSALLGLVLIFAHDFFANSLTLLVDAHAAYPAAAAFTFVYWLVWVLAVGAGYLRSRRRAASAGASTDLASEQQPQDPGTFTGK